MYSQGDDVSALHFVWQNGKTGKFIPSAVQEEEMDVTFLSWANKSDHDVDTEDKVNIRMSQKIDFKAATFGW